MQLGIEFVNEIARAKGIPLPHDGLTEEWLKSVELPMVVACRECEMTMSIVHARVTKHARRFLCQDSARGYDESGERHEQSRWDVWVTFGSVSCRMYLLSRDKLIRLFKHERKEGRKYVARFVRPCRRCGGPRCRENCI